ncbi:SWIB-domain-containing protein [Marasmius fiardii PR-910]|nr:SWIB-domain-containing protein [Marasmius fiardii PR-910]
MRLTMVFDFSTLAPLVQQILSAPGTDLSTISAKRVRRELLALDPSLTADFLKEHKKEVDDVITRVFGQVSGGNEDREAESNRSQSPYEEGGPEEEYSKGDEENEVDDREVKKPKKMRKGKKNGEAISDAELARQLSSEINGRSRRSGAGKGSGRGSSNSTPKRGKRKSKSATTVDSEDGSGEEGGKRKKKKSSGNSTAKGGFAKEYLLSAPLATLLQVEKLSRPQVVKQLWVYIKENGCQNPQNKREILCDDSLKAVFNTDKIDMFKMNKVLGSHLHENEG